MGSRKDKRIASTADNPVGQVVSDSQGNRVWKWASDNLGNTSRLLARLNENDLALAETGLYRIPDENESGVARKPGGDAGMDPYNSSANKKPGSRR